MNGIKNILIGMCMLNVIMEGIYNLYLYLK